MSKGLTVGPDGRPRATWNPFLGIGIWFAVNIVLGTVVLLIDQGTSGAEGLGGGADAEDLLLSAVFAILTMGALWWWLHDGHPTWAAVMGITTGREGWRHLRWGAVAGLILYPVVAFGVGLIVVLVLEQAAGSPVETPEQLDSGLTGIGPLLAVLYGIGIAPIAEEFLFRGIVFRALADRRGFWTGAIVSAVFFGLVHWPVRDPPLPLADALVLPLVMTFTGIGLAWIFERRQSLLAPIAAHMVFNAIGLFLIFVLPEAGG